MAPDRIVLDGSSLTIEQVEAVSFHGVEVCLSAEAVSRMRSSREVVERILGQPDSVYGINTGFGRLCQVAVKAGDLERLQVNLVRSHAAGMRDPLPEPVVRAMLLLRANALARGYSGIRPEPVELLVGMLNKRLHPVVPEIGSVGASGDLAPLAHIALVMVGEGEAVVEGQRLDGASALKKAGLKPVMLKAKEGLSLINGTQLMSAVGALAVAAGTRLVGLANLVGAMSLDAIKGSITPMDERVHDCRPHPGQQHCAAAVRRLLKNSKILASHHGCTKVQDPYSFRCIPQVHGAVMDSLRFSKQVFEIEINSVTDNPLVFPQDGDVISAGNFHGEPVALWLDYLAIALSELGGISERRLDKIMDPVFNDSLPAFLASQGGLDSGYMIGQYTAAALVSENKVLAHPSVVDSIPTSAGKEDHVSMGAVGALKLLRVLENVGIILSIEATCSVQALDYRSPLESGEEIEKFKQKIRKRLPPLDEDRPIYKDFETVQGLLEETGYLLPL